MTSDSGSFMIWLGVVLGLTGLAIVVQVLRTSLVRALYGARIEREVRDMFGPEAEVTHMAVDTRWRLVLAGKRLRIPGSLFLDVSEARLRVRGSKVTLESARGTLSWRSLRAPLDFAAVAAPGAPVHGSLVSRGATWGDGAFPFDFEGELEVGPGDYSVTATRVTCAGATGTGELHGTTGPPVTAIKAEGVGAELLARLVALLAKNPLTIPKAARASGELLIEPTFARRLDLHLETPGSRISAALRVSPEGKLEGSRISGTVALEDALEAGIFTARVKPRPTGTATVDLELLGTTDEPALKGPVRSPRVEVEAPKVVLPATEVVVSIELDARGLRWSGLEATLAQGRLTGSGVLDATGHASDLKYAGVRIEELPLGMDSKLLRGVASGALSLRGVADDVEKLEGAGPLEIAQPEYGFLARASASLEAFGLPALPVRGDRPLRARVEISKGRVVLRGLEGGVEGLRFDGAVEISWKGQLGGRIDARLEERYLRRSVVLAIPALFTGEVSVPLEISGDAREPRYVADLVGTVGRLVTENTVTGAITGIVDGLLGNLLGGERPREDPKKKTRRSGIDGFFDSLLG